MSKSDHDYLLRQRQQAIISAAKICFSRSGFHGASMADISRESGLSAGQIYRYFASKELIVSETIKSIATSWRRFLQTHLPQQTSADNIINADSAFWQEWPFQDRCLLLEMYSEASRHAAVRDILADQEQRLVTALDSLFAQQQPTASSQQRRHRIYFLLMLVDGVACRAFGDRHVDPHELSRINGILRHHLFS